MTVNGIVELISHIVTILATILGGVWAFYRFVKGRVFTPRLTLTVKARQLRIQATDYVLSTIELSNVGLSRVKIDTADLRVCSLSGVSCPDTLGVPRRVSLDTVHVLLAHEWIESGEVVKEQHLLILPLNHCSPLLIDFRVVARGISSSVTAIAEPAGTEEPEAGKGVPL